MWGRIIDNLSYYLFNFLSILLLIFGVLFVLLVISGLIHFLVDWGFFSGIWSVVRYALWLDSLSSV